MGSKRFSSFSLCFFSVSLPSVSSVTLWFVPLREKQMVRRSRSWLWFFAAVAVLGAAAVAINWTYNVRQQLTPEQLAAAEQLWQQHGPADYDLEVEKVVSGAGSEGEPARDHITAKVRGGRVLAAELN